MATADYRQLMMTVFSTLRHNFGMFLSIQTSSHGVDHESENGRHHGKKTRKGKLMPRVFLETIRPKHIERIRQNMHETGGENDARCKGFKDDERVSIRMQHRDGLREERGANADDARNEDRENGNDFKTRCFVFIGARICCCFTLIRL